MEKLLSIVIPTYNIESHIGRCIDSCENQDINKDLYEIIIVNDGSKDNSLNIAINYAEKYNNIRILNQQNKGLSGARNSGLKICKGKYIWFIDGDDYIVPNCLKDIIEYLELNKLDVLYMKYKTVKENDIESQKITYNSNFKNIFFNGTEFFGKAEGDFVMVWRYIFKRDLFITNNLCFCEGIIHEDVEFTHRILYYAQKIGTCNSYVYHYIIRENSIMRSINNDIEFLSIKTIICSIQDFRDRIDNSYFKDYLNRYLQQTIANYFFFKVKNKDYNNNTIRELNNVIKLKYYKHMNIKQCIQYIIMSKFPIIYFNIIKLLYGK